MAGLFTVEWRLRGTALRTSGRDRAELPVDLRNFTGTAQISHKTRKKP